jgi:DNA helicase-2/ATP-dependent DNA helicase PcrA
MTELIEHRVFGPPGTGKTTYLARQIEQASRSYGVENVLVASFTRAAASELAGRKLPVSENRLGTLHSIAYNALGRPKLAFEPDCIEEWNNEHPHWALSGGGESLDEMSGELEGGTSGDRLFNEYMRLRALRAEIYPLRIQSVHAAWTKFKERHFAIDFTDMIEQAINELSTAPGSPQVGFFDEVQDFSRLELDLVRQWGRRMSRIVIAGDDDQALYYFKGATPDAFLQPEIGIDRIRVLGQSYRLPRVIQQYADQWIHHVRHRQPKNYQCRDCEGEILYSRATYLSPGELIGEILPYIDTDRTVMILASCGYMLTPIIKLLRNKGIPFHNPYRKVAHQWNPLAKRGGVSATERLYSYLIPALERRFWRGTEFKKWTDCVEADVFYRGAKAAINEFWARNEDLMSLDEVYKLIQKEHLDSIYAGDLEWFSKHMLSSKTTMQFPLNIVARRGAGSLMESPKVVVGTIHSVKGGEADCVILFPDISQAASDAWVRSREGRDAVVRTFYVGMTRAREKLVLGKASNGPAVNWRMS